MNEEKQPAGNDGSSAASDYVNEQLTTARASLGRTKMVAVIMIVIVLAYMSFVTKGILGYLEPTQAAETAKGVIVTQLAEKGEALASQLKTRIPEMMRQLPEIVLKRMPTIRENIENRISAQLENYVTLTSSQLEPELDAFLDKHKDDINEFLNASQDIDALRADLNDDLDTFLMNYLKNKSDGNETLLEKFEQSKTLLSQIADQTQRLAHDEDLTDREKKTRKAIAVLMAKADFKLYENTRETLNTPDSE